MKLERKIEADFVKGVRLMGLTSLKFTPTGTTGYPDRMIVFPGGCVAFVELKRRGMCPSPIQVTRISEMSDRGFKVGWFDDASLALVFVADCLLEIPDDNLEG